MKRRKWIIGLETEVGYCGWDLEKKMFGYRDEELCHAFLEFWTGDRAGTFLENGGKLYVDTGTHPEYCTPECTSPFEATLYDKAMEQLCAKKLHAFNENAGAPKHRFMLLKHNTDGKIASFGCHENYLVPLELNNILSHCATHPLTKLFMLFLAMRPVLCGNGSYELDKLQYKFKLSQRARFILREKGEKTSTLENRKMIVNKGEPHATRQEHDPFFPARLHIIVGDSNMSEWSTYLKLGTTQLILAALEKIGKEKGYIIRPEEKDGLALQALDNFTQKQKDIYRDVLPFTEVLADINTVELLHDISDDVTFSIFWQIENKNYSAVDMQRVLIQFIEHTLGSDLSRENLAFIDTWNIFLDKIEARDMDFLSQRLDWAIKQRLMERMREKNDKDKVACDKKMCGIDMFYHDISEYGFYNKLKIRYYNFNRSL